ncbi:hypothetical protein [Sinorhizobium fredii]|nr:hypothetical protein [Sinorhizobium fredii]
MVDGKKRSEDPAEGSRETIERELKRSAQDNKSAASPKPAKSSPSKKERNPDEKNLRDAASAAQVTGRK